MSIIHEAIERRLFKLRRPDLAGIEFPFPVDPFTDRFVDTCLEIVNEIGYKTGGQNWSDPNFRKQLHGYLPQPSGDGITVYWILDSQHPESGTSRGLVLNYFSDRKEFEEGIRDPSEALQRFKDRYTHR